MTSKRFLPSSLTEEELIELLNSAEDHPKAEIMEYTNDVVPFLSNYSITPGDTRVSKKLIYSLYKTYSDNPVSQPEFTTKMGLYIQHNSLFFKINKDQFAISQHIYEETKKREKTKSLTYQKHFKWFLDTAEVKSGTKWIEGFVLFYIYKTFCKGRRVHPKLGYTNFHKFLKLHFTNRRIKENRALWFKVDELTFSLLSEPEKEVLRDTRKKEGRD